MKLIEVKSLIWTQKGKLYIIYENVMWIQWPTILVWYCLHDWQTIFIILFSSFWTVDREKKNILDRQQIASQWSLQLIFRMHNSDPTPEGVENLWWKIERILLVNHANNNLCTWQNTFSMHYIHKIVIHHLSIGGWFKRMELILS
jgi:hypothetical protein